MKDSNHQAREWLDNATREQIKYIIREGMFSLKQKKITVMRRRDESNQAIAQKLHCDVRTIDREVTKIYRIVHKIITH